MSNFFQRRGVLIVGGMALGLAVFYLSPVPFFIRLHGALLFFALALLRPDLAVLFVPFSVPLYLIPASLSGIRDRDILLPLHEVTLGLVAAAAVLRWAWNAIRTRQFGISRPTLLTAAPLLLFLSAGIWGTIIALPGSRAEALRELRWLIIEPLIFYLLLKTMPAATTARAVLALVTIGTAIAVLGILQLVGIDLVPLIGEKRSFSENIVETGTIRRVASVYGHPNNLGLFLGRVWPLALVGFPHPRPLSQRERGATKMGSLSLWERVRVREGSGIHLYVYFLTTLLCLIGILISFSRGAWLGAVAATGVFVVLWGVAAGGNAERVRLPRWLGVVAIGGAILTVLVLVLRGGGGSEGTRLLLWREAVGYIQQHPFGIGLDQFYAYHAPDSGRSLIDPALVGTSEQYAAHPHNLVLDLWLRMGPLGIIAFGWLCIRLVRNSLQRIRNGSMAMLALGTLAALAAALTHGLVDQFYFVPDLAFTFWLLLAISELPERSEL